MTGSQGQDTSGVEALAGVLAATLPESGDDCFWPDAYAGDPEAWANREEDRDYYRDHARAVLAAGYVSPADHQRALAAERERAWDEAIKWAATKLETLAGGIETGGEFRQFDDVLGRFNPYRAAIARGNPRAEESP